MLEGEAKSRFEDLNVAGHAAKDAGDHPNALRIFENAEELAVANGDALGRLHVLNPIARALWSMNRFDDATAQLEVASGIASELDLSDERGIAISNMGRIAAVKTVRTVPVAEQKQTLQTDVVPKFKDAFAILKNHPHLYYRYANAQHGSVLSAMAGERRFTARLLVEGVRVAFRRSESPYDQARTYEVNKRGLVQLAIAAALIPFGDRTPFLAKAARDKLIR